MVGRLNDDCFLLWCAPQGSKTEILPLDLRNSIGMASAPKKVPTLGYMLRTVRNKNNVDRKLTVPGLYLLYLQRAAS